MRPDDLPSVALSIRRPPGGGVEARSIPAILADPNGGPLDLDRDAATARAISAIARAQDALGAAVHVVHDAARLGGAPELLRDIIIDATERALALVSRPVRAEGGNRKADGCPRGRRPDAAGCPYQPGAPAPCTYCSEDCEHFDGGLIDEDPPQEHETIAGMARAVEVAHAELREAIAGRVAAERALEGERRTAASVRQRLCDAVHCMGVARDMSLSPDDWGGRDVASYLDTAIGQAVLP